MNSSFKIRPAFKAHFSVKLQSTILSFDAKHMLKIELITRKRSSNPFQKNPHLPSLSENLTIPTFQKTPTRGNRLRWPENRSENRYTRLDYRRGFKMAIAEPKLPSDGSSGKVWSLCRMPFWQTGTNSSSSSQQQQQQLQQLNHNSHNPHVEVSDSTVHSVSSVARSFLPGRRRLRLDPANKLYFPYEPGKQVRSAIRIKNTSRSHLAFKFQTTQPKCCFMRPPGGILSPGESIIATVFKFVEHPENNNEKQLDQKSKVKFKIVSLKVKEGIEYVPELFDEQKDQVAVEQILRVVFLEAERPTPQLEKLNRQLAEAEAALEARKKPPEDTGPRIVGEGLVIDEWKERRERYLARQQVEGVDSV